MHRPLDPGKGSTQAELAREFELSPAHVSHLLRVLESPDLVAMMEEESLAFGAAKALAGLSPEDRTPLLRELRVHKAARDRFPTVEQIARMVQQRQAEEGLPDIPSGCAPRVVDGLHARGRPVVAQLRGTRRKQLRVTFSVEPEDLEWIAALIRQRGGEEEGAHATTGAAR